MLSASNIAGIIIVFTPYIQDCSIIILYTESFDLKGKFEYRKLLYYIGKWSLALGAMSSNQTFVFSSESNDDTLEEHKILNIVLYTDWVFSQTPAVWTQAYQHPHPAWRGKGNTAKKFK